MGYVAPENKEGYDLLMFFHNLFLDKEAIFEGGNDTLDLFHVAIFKISIRNHF